MVNYQILLCEDISVGKVLLGDFDGSNSITNNDAITLKAYIDNPSNYPDFKTDIADINSDGLIDIEDCRILQRIAAGMESKRYKTGFQEIIVCEIGSSSSNFSGKAMNPNFYTKIDGTHELSFSIPSQYLDENTGEIKENELIRFVTNKSKIRLIKNPGPNQEIFHLVVNNKIDKDSDGILSYEYTCTDSFIEELSKTGYSLSFGEEVGQGGLGTIHELAEQILDGTDWKYIKENTGTLYEYSTELEYNIDQQRYDTVYIPKPVHPVKFIPELKRYCNLLSVKNTENGKMHNIYCYEDSEQVVSTASKNLIYNASNFTDLTGWDNYRIEEGKKVSGLVVIPYMNKEDDENEPGSQDSFIKISTTGKKRRTYLLNSTAVASKTSITAHQPYLLKIDKGDKKQGRVDSIEIYNKNPYLNSDATCVYSQSYEENNTIFDEKGTGKIIDLADGRYYVIKSQHDVSSPYIVFNILLDEKLNNDKTKVTSELYIRKFSLFEVKGKMTENTNQDGTKTIITAEENNLKLIEDLEDKETLKKDSSKLSLMNLPIDLREETDTTPSAYTLKKVRYFRRDNYELKDEKEVQTNPLVEDTITYLDFYAIKPKDIEEEKVTSLPTEDIELNKIYWLQTDNKRYQYYQVTVGGQTGGDWDLALYGTGANDKIRTLKAEKSNRFNLLQELSELFKAWCVFNIKDNGDGTFEKQVWFKEKAINHNFSGFHKGVNLHELERKSDSNEIVTKIFVEDIENEFAEDGFVTIRRAKTNPWKENYYYNFKYYVDQNLCVKDERGYPYIETDVQTLYREVGKINNSIFDYNDKITTSAGKLEELSRNIKSLAYCVAGANTRIASLTTDINNKKVSKSDKKELKSKRSEERRKKSAYEKQQAEAEKAYAALNKDYQNWLKEVEALQTKKINLISHFESKYSQYIKEGVWQDTSYVDNNTYYYDSQKVSNTSALPATSWTISVLDGSVVEEMEDYQFSVGDLTFLVDNEFFGVEKNIEKNYIFEVLISGIKENFDDPSKNEIEVRNYLTSFEDIFQRISAATQTLQLKEQTYDKAANFNSKGEIDKDILQKTLSDNALVLANASDNSYTLDDSGLSLQSLVNPMRKMRILADGIFITNSLDAAGQPEWKTGITADGINASVITAGEINTANIRIFSDGQPNQTWNALGITSYQLTGDEVDTNRFIRFDNFGFYFVNEENDGINWNFDSEGNAWFEIKETREKAIQQIYDNADLSITEKGFRLNLSDNQTIVSGDSVYTINTEAVRLGYLGEAEIGDFKYDAYGLYIEGQTSSNIIDNKGNVLFQSETSIRFSTDGNNYIGNWKIEKDWIHNDGSSIGAVSLETDSLTFTGKSDMTGHGSAHYGTNNLTINPKKGAKNMHDISLSTSTGLTLKYNDNDIIKTNNDTFWIKNLEIDENFYLRTGNITLLYTDYSNNDVPYLGLNGALRTAIRPSGAESTEYVMKNGVWEVGNELCHGIICYKKYSSGRTKDMGIAIYDGEGSYDAKLYFIYNGSSKLIASFPK